MYTYTPNYDGQLSTETEGGEKLYKFAILQSIFLSFPTRWEYFVYPTSDEDRVKVADVRAICQLMYASGSVYDMKGAPVMKLTQTSLFSGGDESGAATGFDVEVSAGMDPLQAVAIAIAAPQSLEN